MEKQKPLSNKVKEDKKNNKIIFPKEKTNSDNVTPKLFKKLNQNILKIIKNRNEKEKNIEKNMNIYKKIRLIKNEKLFEEIINNNNYKKNKNILRKSMFQRNLSYTTKNKKEKNKERDILSSLYTKKRKKDFLSVTSNINYLLERNQKLLNNEKKFYLSNRNVFGKHNTNYYLDKNIFKQNNFSSRNGMYGKKEGIPFFYEYSYTYRNEYVSKSEKSRHETLLNELNKLKFYLKRNPNEELLIIKDFLQKFHINNISKYSDEKLLYICKLICKIKQNNLINLIKPDSNIKTMIYNLLNISLETDENEKNRIVYNTIYYPQNNFRKISLNKNKTLYNIKCHNRKKFLDLYDTNSKLKYLDKQKELYRPNKNYSQNFDLLVNEMSKEIKEIEKNIKKSREIKREIKIKDDDFFMTQTKSKSLSSKSIHKNDNLILSPINNHKEQNKNKGFFLFFTKNLGSNINIKKIQKPLNFCLKRKYKKDKNIQKDDKGNSIDYMDKERIHTKEIVKRLYYAPTHKKFGFNDIKKNLKLTEYVALNFAKQKLYFNRIDRILKPDK